MNPVAVPMRAGLRDYYELIKPRLTGLSLISAAVGFYLAPQAGFQWTLFILTLAGTGLIAAGSMVLNQWMEWELDAKMQRTSERPIPSGRMTTKEAAAFGALLMVSGFSILMAGVNPLAVGIGAATVLSYLFIYTPLKRVTPSCTLVGAVPGALPPLLGWSAATGTVSPQAWILFAVLFFWQMPHFYSIAWMYREDYRKAGFKMLSVVDPSGIRISRQIMLFTLALVLVSLLPYWVRLTGPFYLASAAVLGAYLYYFSFQSLKNLEKKARPLFHLSIAYLTVLFICMVLDKAG